MALFRTPLHDIVVTNFFLKTNNAKRTLLLGKASPFSKTILDKNVREEYAYK